MNSNYVYRLKILVFLFGAYSIAFSQEAKFKIAPHANGVTTISNGFIETGPIFYNSKMEFKPFIRIPITDKKRSITQIDRNSNSFTGVFAYSFIKDITKESGPIKRLYITGKLEWATGQYKYYPDSTLSNEIKSKEQSISGELKIGYYKTEGQSFAKQYAPEFRLRYSRDVENSDEIGIVMNNSNGISTVKNLILEKPEISPLFSPAFALNYYPGKGNFSYTPAFFFNFKGKNEGNNPFNSYSRLRIETWIFYYPTTEGNTGVKLGISPFISIRTNGKDSLNKLEYGGMIQLSVSTNMLHFL